VALPSFISAGPGVALGTAVTVAWPIGVHQAGDLGILPVQTANQTPANNPPSEWLEAPSSPQSTGTAGAAGAVRFTAYYRFATSDAEADVSIGDSGDHQLARILVFRGVGQSSPFDTSAGTIASTSTTAIAIPGGTTTGDDRLILLIAAHADDSGVAHFSAWANADLANVGEVLENNTTAGTGGGFGIASGEMAVAGSYGTTTATLVNGSPQAVMMLALAPPAPSAGESPSWVRPVATRLVSVSAATVGMPWVRPGRTSLG